MLPGGLTIIRGRNLSGKSWIRIATYWCLFNESVMSFEQMQRETGKPVAVEVEFADGRVVRRERTTGRNVYVLRGPGAEQELLAGRGPNDQVLEFTGVRPFQLADKWAPLLQFQGEHDPIFLLSEPAGVQESALARVTGADVIEQAARNLHSSLTSVVRSRGAADDQCAATLDELRRYERLDEASGLLDDAQTIEAKVRTEEVALAGLEETLARLVAQSERVGRMQTILAKMPESPDVSGLQETYQDATSTSAAVDRWAAAETQAANAARVRDVQAPDVTGLGAAAQTVELADRFVQMSEAAAARQAALERIAAVDAVSLDAMNAIVGKGNAFVGLLVAAAQQGRDADGLAGELDAADAAYIHALRAAGVCPTCGQNTAALGAI